MTLPRLYQLATSAQVVAEWANFDGTSTIYLTGEPGLNQISLTLENQLGNPLVLPPGTAAAWNTLPQGQSAIYLFFEGLLSNAEVAAIDATFVGATEWTQQSYLDDGGLAYLVLAPNAQVQVPAGQALEFRLTNVLATSSIASPLYITLAGVSGATGGETSTQAYVNVQNQPQVGNQALDLLVGFAGTDLVYTGGESNTLTLYLTNPSLNPLVPGGSASWGANPPTFQLTLVFGDDAGALTSLDQAPNVQVNLSEEYGNVWKPVARQVQSQHPTWFLQPSATGGGQVLGTGENATVTFDITGIATTLPQGLTYAYLSYANVPGYNDGFFALEIVKVAPVVISAFFASPANVTDAVTGTTVRLDFLVENASYVSVTNTSYAQATTGVQLKDFTTVPVYATTTFTLLASNFATGQQVAQSLEVAVTPDLFHLVPTGTVAQWVGNAPAPLGWAQCDGTQGTPDLSSQFVVNSQLWMKWWNGTNWVWENRMGGAGSTPSFAVGAAAVGGHACGFFVGLDGNVWTNAWDGASWIWTCQGTPGWNVTFESSSAAAGAITDGTYGLAFLVGGDGNLWTCWSSGAGTCTWTNLGIPAVAGIALTRGLGSSFNPITGMRYAFAQGNDGNVYVCWFNPANTEWTWATCGSPAAQIVWPGGGCYVGSAFTLWGIGSDRNLWTLAIFDPSGWSNAGTPDGVTITGVIGTLQLSSEAYSLFVSGSDGNLWAYDYGGSTAGWNNHGAPASGVTPDFGYGAFPMESGAYPNLLIGGSDGNLWIRWSDNSQWYWANMGTPAGHSTGYWGTAVTVGSGLQPFVFISMRVGHITSGYALVYIMKTT